MEVVTREGRPRFPAEREGVRAMLIFGGRFRHAAPSIFLRREQPRRRAQCVPCRRRCVGQEHTTKIVRQAHLRSQSTDQDAVADEAKSVTRQIDHATVYATRKGSAVARGRASTSMTGFPAPSSPSAPDWSG